MTTDTEAILHTMGLTGLFAAGVVAGYEFLGPVVCEGTKTLSGGTIGGLLQVLFASGVLGLVSVSLLQKNRVRNCCISVTGGAAVILTLPYAGCGA